MQNEMSGILVLDDNNAELLATGLGKLKLVSSTLARRWKRRLIEPIPKLFMVEDVDEPLTCLSFESQGACCFLIFPVDTDNVLLEFFSTVDFAADIVRHLITSPYEAMTVVDRRGVVRYLSPVHEKFFGLGRAEGVGQHVTKVIENTRLHEVAASGKSEVGHVQQMNGSSRVVTRTPIFDRDSHCVGAIGQVMFKGPEAIRQLGEQVAQLKKQVMFYERELSGLHNRSFGLDQIVGTSDAVRQLKADIVKVASLDVPVLLVGESGTGKELVAHAIQMLSPRSGASMVLVNAAALPANLVESELFGYEAGAFTGADRKGRHGKFELADKGTLFLDEIGDMPTDMQAKLLRVLQDGTFERVGGTQGKRSDFRLISATNRNFKTMIADGVFRLDLFYRISTITLRLPPLRERLQDIPLLADTFLANFATRHRQKRLSLDGSAVACLQAQPWPGNIRQLQHAVERAAIFCDTDVLTAANFANAAYDGMTSMPTEPVPASGLAVAAEPSMKLAKDKVESEIIIDAMRRYDGNKKKVAETLNISRSYLYKKLALLDIK
ncbi:hypothetical protein BH11PSE7_BH11PSE7_27500 [soil metagenome]